MLNVINFQYCWSIVTLKYKRLFEKVFGEICFNCPLFLTFQSKPTNGILFRTQGFLD